MNRRLAFVGALLVGFLTVLGWHAIAQPGMIAQSNSRLLVSAAVSLKDALEEIKPLYQKSNPGASITYNFAASGALQQQIEQGAPVDIFISAAKKQMDALESKGLLVAGSRRNFVTNRLVLIVPSNSRLRLSRFADLTSANVKRIAVGEPRSVPAGQYAEQVFQKLGIAQQIASKRVFGNNVRQVLAAVESGNADAGIVYLTDAKTSNRVKVVATAREADHSPIVYPMAVLQRSKNINAAKGFAQFLSSTQARFVLLKYGFVLPK